MRWLLVYRDPTLGRAWHEHFADLTDVEIVAGDITAVACDAVVSPANSFGFMDGGLDHALSERFGWSLQSQVQAAITRRPIGELLVGEAVLIPTADARTPWLIVAPTMRVPMRLRQSVNAYLAMKAILSVALNNPRAPLISTVAIPGLGTGVGGLSANVAASQMREAFDEIAHRARSYPKDFGEAQHRHVMLNPAEINLSGS